MTDAAIQIENGVPLPPKAEAGGRRPKYPLGDLAVGQSFRVEDGRGPDLIQDTLSGCIRSWRIHNDPARQFTTRREGDGVRVWRIA